MFSFNKLPINNYEAVVLIDYFFYRSDASIPIQEQINVTCLCKSVQALFFFYLCCLRV
uniref:Uncharacterized protein n=1 Tax=Arundo donax TaxID=35708 RepID=A0A0A9G7Q8_ARUDO